MVNVPSLLKVLETVIILNQAGLLNGKYKKSLWSNKTRVYEVYRRVMETDSLRLPPPVGLSLLLGVQCLGSGSVRFWLP